MKKLAVIFISVFFVCMLIAGNVPAKQRGIHVISKKGKELYLYKDYHALVVGVGDYEFWPDLQGAVKDARAVAGELTKTGMKVKLLLNPTSQALKEAMNNLTYGVGKEKDRAILFFFSGHGETETLATGEKLGYIIPKDAPLPSKDRIGFTNRAISMHEIETYALRIQSKHVLMIFDSCFSGSVFASLKGVPTDITEKSNRPVRQFIAAGNEEEQVPDMSVFKTCLIQGIKGEADANSDGYVTGSELGMYLDSSVVNYSKGCQHPQYGKIRHPKLDKGDFIFKLASSGATVTRPQPEPERTTLSVSANVKGARVLVDGREVGTIPLSDIEVSPGDHRLTVEKQGYEAYKKRISLEKGRSMSLYVDLSQTGPRKGRLYVETEPADTEVRILNIGPGYSQGMELEPGRYHVEVSALGYESKKQWVDLAAGQDKYMSVRLVKIAGAATGGKAFTNSLGMKFVKIPSGSFMMGSSISPSEVVSRYGGKEEWFEREHPQHRVTISKPFYMQTMEVTVGQWRSFVEDTGYKTEAETGGAAYVWTGKKWEKKEGAYWDNPGFGQNDNNPVTCVSWNDVQKFVKWLNRKEGADKYRLPTEAEWEYAARAGTTTLFYTGNCLSTEQANYNGNYPGKGCSSGTYREKTIRVGTFSPNPWGLYDMHGNVWEWCQDWWYGDYLAGSVTDPEGPSSGSYRVLRGGSWSNRAWHCRSALRLGITPGDRSNNYGFRLVLSPGQWARHAGAASELGR
ncbi:MAG: SUMF1/EgtB/PvdO family nonheme iron enzyme [Bacteroidota bacterium]|nr:SUMF1/EgtB/PvdO family nonheme iron enzyme [Bacteroidota bacterium]